LEIKKLFKQIDQLGASNSLRFDDSEIEETRLKIVECLSALYKAHRVQIAKIMWHIAAQFPSTCTDVIVTPSQTLESDHVAKSVVSLDSLCEEIEKQWLSLYSKDCVTERARLGVRTY
jgi:hypothetical protein